MQLDERSAEAFEQAPAALGVFVADGSLKAMNSRLRALFGTGYSGEPTPPSVAEAFHLVDDWREFLRMASETLGRHTQIARLKARNGAPFSARLCSVRFFPVSEGKDPLWLLAVEEVLSAEVASEEDLIREIELLALVHDLRNPLLAARISMELFLKQGHDANSLRAIQCIDHAVRMVQELLDLARSTAKQRTHAHGKLELCELAALVREGLEGSMGAEGQITMQAEPLRGWWNPGDVRRIVGNLLENALKHGSPGGAILIRVEQLDRFARLSVENRGRALTEKERLRLFSRFERGAEPERAALPGWGLGLAIVRHLAETHGGWVEVSSPDGQGNRFSVLLPLAAD